MRRLEAQTHTTGARFSTASTTVSPGLRRFNALGQLTRFVIIGAALATIAGAAVGWAIDSQVTQIVLGQVVVRATDHVALVILNHVTEADFEPPYPQAKLDDLGARLMPLLARARGEGSRVLRVNLFAPDGTIIYSDLASLRGRVLSPRTRPPLARALAGSAEGEASRPGTTENADLIPFSAVAFETYVPVRRGGEVIGAYELYVDPAPVRQAIQLVWVTLAGGFGLLVLMLLAAAHVIFRRRGRRPGPAGDEFVAVQESGGIDDGAGAVGGLPGIDPQRQDDQKVSNGTSNPGPGYCLTRRELEVVRLMATKRSYGEIAAELVISEETVRTHAKSILHKLRQPDRTCAVAAAVEAGLLNPEGTPGEVTTVTPGSARSYPIRSANSPLISESGSPSIVDRLAGSVEVSGSAHA